MAPSAVRRPPSSLSSVVRSLFVVRCCDSTAARKRRSGGGGDDDDNNHRWLSRVHVASYGTVRFGGVVVVVAMIWFCFVLLCHGVVCLRVSCEVVALHLHDVTRGGGRRLSVWRPKTARGHQRARACA